MTHTQGLRKGEEKFIIENKTCTVSKPRFLRSEYPFGNEENTTFCVYVHAFNSSLWIQITVRFRILVLYIHCFSGLHMNKAQDGRPPTPHCTSWLKGQETEISTAGRRRTLLIAALPWSASFILLGIAPSRSAVFFARITMGFMVGLTSPAAQLYIAECVEPKIRGILGSLTATLMALGILVTYVIGKFTECDVLAWIISSSSVFMLVGMYFCPESPSWLVYRKRMEEARRSICRLRGLSDTEDDEITKEIDRINEAVNNQEDVSVMKGLEQMAKSLKPLFLSLILMFFQQFSGINAIIFHAGTIFKASGSSIDNNISAIVVGAVQFVFTTAAMIIVDKSGRRILLLLSSVVMFFSLFPLGLFFYLKNNNFNVGNIQWIPLISIVGYMIGHSIGYNTIPFLIMSEIFPPSFRNIFSALSSSFNLFCLFLVVFFYSSMVDCINEEGVFWLYASICLISIPSVYYLLPETKGKSLEEVEKLFRNHSEKKTECVNSGFVNDSSV
ncbi:facilitated trehalose transporter Tret1-2 homolog isoform X3 [Artemia franciscana]|uniref:facilitated trehalose transporter Tret1-2 homolog isoform X3 n=1 Tax=Artemia franciscana TaxID=6661 RepID=UPI0032DA8559